MLVLFRSLAVMAVVLTVVYWLVSAYARSLRRERLERDWDENPPENATGADRAAFVARGMEAYRHSLRHRLIWLIYVLPLVATAAIVYTVNVQ
ncbi:hypothetical protein [Frigidibacter oleivorans]|uniref:hypothetical protein n=1 Tax=Frigidibacter oleivorans TaxID=2487129 RepID=UPI000F8DAD57|nr:hypothetical protein [Frigidibacter oleivorans]